MCDEGEAEVVEHFFTALYRHVRGEKGDGEVDEETVEGWQEMEGKEKVVCVVDEACENGRVRKEWRGCTEDNWIE